MPKISYKQLTKYLEGYKKMEKPDPLHVALLDKVKVLAKALHDAQSTTTQDERQLLYNDMMQYIEIYDSRFQSEPKNGRNNQDLDLLINFGNSINTKVNALVSK